MDCRRTPRDGRSSAGRFAQSAASRATLRTWPSSAARGSASRPQRDPPATPPSRGLRAITVLRPCCSPTTPTTRPKHCCCNSCAVPARVGLPRCPPRASTASVVVAAMARRATRSPRRLRRIARGCATSTTNPTQMHATVATRCATPSCRRCAISHPGIRLRSCGPRSCRPMPPRSSTTWPRSTRAMRTTARRSIAPSSRGSTRAAGRTCCGGSCASSACRRRRERALPTPLRSCSAALPARGSRSATPVPCSACTAADLSSSANRSNPTRACGQALMTCRCPTGRCGCRAGSVSASPHAMQRTRRSRFAAAAAASDCAFPVERRAATSPTCCGRPALRAGSGKRSRGSTAATRSRRW